MSYPENQRRFLKIIGYFYNYQIDKSSLAVIYHAVIFEMIAGCASEFINIPVYADIIPIRMVVEQLIEHGITKFNDRYMGIRIYTYPVIERNAGHFIFVLMIFGIFWRYHGMSFL